MAALLGALALAGAAHATAANVGPPDRVTALGDSITRAYDSQGSGCGAFTDCQAFSWATGSNTNVNSYFRRLQAINPSAVLSNPTRGNDAVTGAKVANLNAQATTAIAGNPDLVLILIGANDVCTSSEAAMTSVSDFRTRFQTAMDNLSGHLPDARIQVMSIPNIFNLWNVLKGNFLAQLTWGAAGICQSMLASPTSTATADVQRRARVQQRNIDFNTQLQQVCAQYIHCRYDGGAAYSLAFASSDVSTLDYFHPNTNGQAKAASAAWSTTFNYTDLTAPTTTISRDRPSDGADDWYRNNVTVTLSATDPNSAVSGSEYYYKLQGADDKPWTRYTGPFTISDAGQTEVTARSVDANGNIEASKTDVVKIDKTAPSFSLACPSNLLLNDPASITISGAVDDRSGFVSDPNGSTSIPTATAGHFSHIAEIQDKAGNTTSHSCAWDVAYPVPGTPAISSGAAPNQGVFGLAWTPSADPDGYPTLQYTLQHRNAADTDWSDLDAALSLPAFTFAAGSPESEGTWRYRVKAHDGALETAYSDASDPVKVDRSAPATPSLTVDRAPEDAADGGWHADTVTVTTSDNGDPDLADGSAGSGVDPASVPAPAIHATSGTFTDSASVSDRAGNASPAASLTVQVDATAPDLSVTCPVAVLLGAPATTTVAASDGESGLASDPSGTVALDTSTVGARTVTRTATDRVGHSTTRSCTTSVRYMFSGLLQPINPDGSSIFKLGSTVPVKFAATDASSARVGTVIANLHLAKVSNNVEGSYVEADSTAAATTGTLFRSSASGEQYIYNLSTKGLTTGTWSLRVSLDDGTAYTTRISLR